MAKNEVKITAEMVQQVLSSLSIDDLNKVATERRMASLDPLKTEYADKMKELAELEQKIVAIQSDWEPPKAPKVADRILAWVGEQKSPVTKVEIGDAVKTKFITSAIKKLVGAGDLIEKAGKFSIKED